jgi:predicted glutamine amidotransferase
MCVICVKPKGAIIDTRDIEQMFDQNPHGGGFAVIQKGKVYYEKGFMNVIDLIKSITKFNTPENELVLHCRLATVGEITPELTHPFQLTKNRKKLLSLKGYANAVLFHNGSIFSYKNSDLSDTAELVLLLADLKLKPEKIVKVLKLLNTQKFVLLTSSKIYMIGNFHKYKNLYFSNLTWNHKAYFESYFARNLQEKIRF